MMKKNKKAFTLLELQIASLMMVLVLVATGVIFYYTLAIVRYMHDAFEVFYNANAAIKVFQDEVMVANCYGSRAGGGTPPYVPAANSYYGTNGPAFNAYQWMPTLNGLAAEWTDALFLRSAVQTSTERGELSPPAGDFNNHECVVIYRWTGLGEINTLQVARQTGGAAAAAGGGLIVARHVTDLRFRPIAYNCLAIRVTVTGTVPNPMHDPLIPATGGPRVYSITLSKMITLRCAPGRALTPTAPTW
ncbi:MAG: hypothetical protein KKH34_09850 [Candidatus Omnitrophica bacterium]|nr:hypothetical protein [Candidatus Omnitrophota bacterium]MCG2703018.1 hypothetical protein [Candidatus Omnitrophota bacterium]